jgi:hypothetical protein
MKLRLTQQQYYTLAEKIFFGAMLLLVALPVTGSTWFVTEDGASHSYNAGVLYNLLSGNDAFLGQYYKINTLPSPNWLGHLLLAYTGHWFGVAEGAKILHLLYIAGFALAFRRLMFTVSPQPRVMSYFAFPVIYNVVFLFGFYNFCLGMVLLLIVLNCWLRYSIQPTRAGALWLLLTLTLLWFSHQLTWAYAGMFIGFHLLYQFISTKQAAIVIRRTAAAFAVALPSLICFGIYTVSGGGSSGTNYTTVAERWNSFSDGSFVRLFFTQENAIGIMFLLLLLAQLIVGGLRDYRLRKSYPSGAFSQKIFWLLMFTVAFFLMLFMPEVIGDGGVIGIRVIWIAIVFLIILAAQFRTPSRVNSAAVTAAVMLTLLHNAYFGHVLNEYNLDAHAARTAGNYIRDKSTILVLPFTTNWLHLHMGQYAVAEREVVLLDNYEAQHNYFPIEWNYEKIPHNYQLASLSWPAVNCTWGWPEVKNKPAKQVDYVMIVGDLKNINDTLCRERIACAMDSLNYKAVFHRREVTLYEYLPE